MNVPIINFNAGELSPLIDSRADVEKYAGGCRHLENFFPRIYGAAERRPGTKFILPQNNSSNNTIRMLPFVYSSDTAYAGEAGNLYFRFFDTLFYEGQTVYLDGNEVTYATAPLTTPYLEADLFKFKTKQVGDVQWITHPLYPQAKLSRIDPTTFSLGDITFTKGPFLLRNDLIDPDVTDTAEMVLNGTVGFGDSTDPAGASTTSWGVTWSGQTVISPYDVTVSSVWLYIQKLSTPGDCNVSIRATTTDNPATGLPTGADLATSTIAEASLPSSSTWTEFVLSTPVTFVAQKLYAIIMSAPSGTGTGDGVGWKRYTDNPVSHISGMPVISGNSGSTWSLGAGDDRGVKFVSQSVITPTVGFFGTMTCQSTTAVAIPYFETSQIGALFKLTYPRQDKVSKGEWIGGSALPFTICPAILVKGSFRFSTSGTWRATIELQRNENGAGWETIESWVSENNFNASYTKVEDADNVLYRAQVVDYTSSSPRLRANITVSNSSQDCIVRITGLVSSTTANIEVVSGEALLDATRRWAEGAWSDKRGFPSSVTFFEDRCIYSGNSVLQTQVTPTWDHNAFEPKILKAWLSHTGDYENFEEDVKDADSFSLTIPTTNDSRWVEALEAAVIGTSGDEWRIGSNKMEQPITPTNFSVRQQTSYGCFDIQPLKINDQILFADFVGRKIRELAYNGDKYVAPDLSALAEHITKSGIAGMSYQRNPDSILWSWLTDGTLLAMVYERHENVVAWAKMPVDGKVLSLCVIPGATEDEIWLAVKRNLGGSDVINIERMGKRAFDYVDNAYYVDCGLTFCQSENVTWQGEDVFYEGRIVMRGASFNSVSGLSHLNGEVVSVLADGEAYTDLLVSAGTVTLPVYAQTAQVGLPYTSKLQPMRIVTGSGRGTSQGSISRIPKMTVSFQNAMDPKTGASDSALNDIDWDDPQWENLSDVGGLFTGDVTVSVDGGYSLQNPIIVSTDAPFPCTVRSLIPRLDVTSD